MNRKQLSLGLKFIFGTGFLMGLVTMVLAYAVPSAFALLLIGGTISGLLFGSLMAYSDKIAAFCVNDRESLFVEPVAGSSESTALLAPQIEVEVAAERASPSIMTATNASLSTATLLGSFGSFLSREDIESGPPVASNSADISSPTRR